MSRVRPLWVRLGRLAPAAAILLALSSLRPARAESDSSGLESQVREFRLKNGLLVLVVERHFAPVFSFVTFVDAGGVDEPVGKTGIAHMMEHMAFKGSPMVGTTDARLEAAALAEVDDAWDAVVAQKKLAVFSREDSTALKAALDRFKDAQGKAAKYVVSNAFAKVLDENGEEGLNAFTSADETAYFYSLPANKLELWALLEGNRMTYPVFREFYKERDVVIDERRIGTESSPRGRLRDETLDAAFTAHPYRNGTIGFRSDLEAFSRRDAEAFFKAHYNAANMVVVIVGDVKADDVHRLAEQYFEGIPSGPKPDPVLTIEPPPAAEREVRTHEDAQPLCYVAYYGGPSFTDPNYLSVDALADILASGRSSRLYTSLVKEKKLATNVNCSLGMPGEKYPNLVWFSLVPAPGVSPDTLVATLQRELDGLADHPITAEELAGYRSRSKAQFIRGLHGNNGLAFQLAYYQTRAGDWHEMFRWIGKVDKLTTEQVSSQAARIFVRLHRTVGIMDSNARTDAKGGKS